MTKSRTISIYGDWADDKTPEQVAFIDSVYAVCEANYDAGGDTVVECFDPDEILDQFKTLDEVRKYCGIKLEQALNTRWGDDEDEELKAYERFRKWDSVET